MEDIKAKLVEIYDRAMKENRNLSVALDTVRQLFVVECEMDRKKSTETKET